MYFYVGKLVELYCKACYYHHCLHLLTSKFAATIINKPLLYNVNPLKVYTNTKMVRNLAAFDFDHTIVDDNTDIVVRNLISKDSIPLSVKKLYKVDGWTSYMQGVFELLHIHGQHENEIVKAISDIPATKGMPELIRELSDNLNYDVIIISDSNSYLINTWLENHDIDDKILRVFTNPAKFDRGVLRVNMYHLQTHCKLSTKNLCKGQILDEFIEARKDEGIIYNKILYAGDGTNDFCPILRLKESDLACVRNNYNCVQLINSTRSGKPIASTGQTYNIKAKVLVWDNGFEILEALKN